MRGTLHLVGAEDLPWMLGVAAPHVLARAAAALSSTSMSRFSNRLEHCRGGTGGRPPTVLTDGQIVGSWTHTGRGARRTVAATPFTSLPRDVTKAIPEVHSALP